jgi:hypothetical protein
VRGESRLAGGGFEPLGISARSLARYTATLPNRPMADEPRYGNKRLM